MSAKRRKQGADARELLISVCEPAGQVGDLVRVGPRGGAQDGTEGPLDLEATALEPERVGVPARQRVLDVGTRRQLGARRQVEQRPNLGHHGGEAIVHSSSIIRRGCRPLMGRRAYLRRRLGPWFALGLLVLFLAAPARAADPALTARLTRALAVPNVDPARTAALAVDLRTGAVVFERNAALPLVPASNQKLPVTYGALALLGPSYRFQTEVVGTGALVGDVWRGDIWLRGLGDPTLKSADLAALARDVAAWGIRRVDGAVIADESWFDAKRTAPGWRPRFLIHESAPLSALVVDRARYRGRTSANPALAAGSLLRRALEAAGVEVKGRTRTGVLATTGIPLARDLSRPLQDIVRYMGRESDNFIAEMLVKQLGALHADRGSTAAGTRVLRQALADAGVPLAGVRLADGSGLSGLDRLTASAVVALLEAGFAEGELRDAFLQSFAVAGVNGTLEDRMERRPARGQVLAKTGTTDVASALSGFVRDRYAFAVLQNGRPVSTYWSRIAQDRFATALAAAG